MSTTVSLTGSGNWIVPARVTSLRVQLWAGNASGGGTGTSTGWAGGGGGTGEYAEEPAYAVTAGQSVAYSQGAGGAASTNAVGKAGGNTTFGTVTAHGGQGGKTASSGTAAGGAAGTGSAATIHHDGGAGGTGTAGTSGGGGAGSPGPSAAGNSASGNTGGASVTGGAAGPNGSTGGNGTAGTAPNGTSTGGSAGSGAYSNSTTQRASGAGSAGQILITYTVATGPVPYVIADPAPAQTKTATVVPVTTASNAGDAIVVAASTPPASTTNPASVSDSQGNAYLLAEPVAENLAVWVAPGSAKLSVGTSGSTAPVFGCSIPFPPGPPTMVSVVGTMAAGKLYNSGVPSSWPGSGGPIPSGCTMPLNAIKITLTGSSPYISSSDQTALATFFASMPTSGTPIVTINQEGEAGRFGYTAAQVAGSHNTAYNIFKANAPSNALYCQDFETYSASSGGLGSSFPNYVCCAANGQQDLPLYMWDWYPTTNTTTAVNSISPGVGYVNGLVSGARHGVGECNYTTGSGITSTVETQTQWFTNAWNYAVSNNFFAFITYFYNPHSVNWPPDGGTSVETELTSINAASGTGTGATGDSVTVNWSGTSSVTKDVIVVGIPGIASSGALDTGATTEATGTGTAISVTSGPVTNPDSMALLVISNASAGGTPSSLGSFTSLGTVELSAEQYLTVAYQYLTGTTAVTGSATITSAAWSAQLIVLSPSAITTAQGTTAGADIAPGSYAAGTLTGSIAAWESIIGGGRTLNNIRVFFASGGIPASLSASGLSSDAGVRRVLMSLKPAFNPVSTSDKAALDTFLSSCQTGGLDAKVALWAGPDTSMTAAQYAAMIAYYGPTVRKYYPLVYVGQASSTVTAPGTPATYYPGNGTVDECAYTYYCADYLNGVTLDTMGTVADEASLPFSIWELGVIVSGSGPQTQAQGTAYMIYVLNWLRARALAGKAIGDVSYYDYVNSASNWNFVIQAAPDPSNYLAGLYDLIYDAVTPGATGPNVVSLAAQVTPGIGLQASLTTTGGGGGGGGGSGGGGGGVSGGGQFGPNYPALSVQIATQTATPVAVLGTFILDDPVYGQLDSGRLGDNDTWTDITAFVRSGTIARNSTRTQGPLYAFQAATCTLVLNNGDGRFDQDNTASPLAGSIRPMVPVRISATWKNVSYPLFFGFADSWTDDGINYAGRYAQTTLNCTDSFKVLAGIYLAALTTPVGNFEDSGARITRILNDSGWYTGQRAIAAGDSQLQGTSYGDYALNLMQLAADSEIGELYQDASGDVTFRNRQAILTDTRSTTPQVVFGDSPGTLH